MTYILATDKPLLWAVGNPIIETGITEINNLTVSGQTIVYDSNENAYLGKLVGKAGAYNPLPNIGGLCEAGVIYGYNNGLVICRQTHNRTIYPPEQTPALFIVYRADAASVLDWVVGEKVEVGMHRIYNTVEYVVIQAHVTQSDWTPDKTPTLWGKVAPATGAWTVGVAYKIGDLVTYQGSTYKCLQAHTSIATWTPTAAVSLWQKQ